MNTPSKIFSAAKSRAEKLLSAANTRVHTFRNEETEYIPPKYPSFAKYNIPTNLNSPKETIEINGIMRDNAELHKDEGKELTFNYKNGKLGFYLVVPQSTTLASFNKRAKEWVNRMLDRVNPNNRSAAANYLCNWLSSNFPEEFENVGKKLKFVKIEKTTAEEAVAVWSEANVPFEKAKIILRHFRTKYGASFQVPFNEIRDLGILTVQRTYGEHSHIAEPGEKPEKIMFWHMNFCDMIAADMERLLKAYGLKIYGYTRNGRNMAVDIVVGSDHGQGSSRFVVKINLLHSEARKESGKIQTGSRQFTFAKIRCRKEREEFLNLISPHLRSMCREIKHCKLVAYQVNDSDENGDNEEQSYKCMFVPIDENHHTWTTIIERFNLFICGDLAFYAVAMGRDGCSGSRCPWCDLTHSQFCDPNSDPMMEGEPLTYEKLLTFEQRRLDPDNELDTGGLKCQPMLEEDNCQYINPILHYSLGLTNKLHNAVIDFLDDKVEIILPEEQLKRQRLENDSKNHQELDIQIKQMEAAKKSLGVSKKVFTDQVNANRKVLSDFKDEIGKYSVSVEQKKQFKAQMKQLREVNKQLSTQASVLFQYMKEHTANINALTPRRKELRESINAFKKELKELRKPRKKHNNGIEHKVDMILTQFKIAPAAYHGGDFIGNDCQRYMNNGVEIFNQLRAACEERRKISQRCTEQQLTDKLNLYLRVVRAMDVTFKELRKPAPTTQEMNNLEQIIKMLETYWREAGLSITIKAHALFKHALPQVRRLGGIADLVEDFVEKAHQEGKGLEDLTKRMSQGFQAQEEVQIKRQWATTHPEVQETKNEVATAARRKRKNAPNVSEANVRKQQRRDEFQAIMLGLPT